MLNPWDDATKAVFDTLDPKTVTQRDLSRLGGRGKRIRLVQWYSIDPVAAKEKYSRDAERWVSMPEVVESLVDNFESMPDGIAEILLQDDDEGVWRQVIERMCDTAILEEIAYDQYPKLIGKHWAVFLASQRLILRGHEDVLTRNIGDLTDEHYRVLAEYSNNAETIEYVINLHAYEEELGRNPNLTSAQMLLLQDPPLGHSNVTLRILRMHPCKGLEDAYYKDPCPDVSGAQHETLRDSSLEFPSRLRAATDLVGIYGPHPTGDLSHVRNCILPFCREILLREDAADTELQPAVELLAKYREATIMVRFMSDWWGTDLDWQYTLLGLYDTLMNTYPTRGHLLAQTLNLPSES